MGGNDDFASLILSIWYLLNPAQADEKVRRICANLTVEHLRVARNKATTPYLSILGRLLRPKFTSYEPRRIKINRPNDSRYKEVVRAWLYFDGSFDELRDQRSLILGFDAMNPPTSDDRLLAWAGKTKVPILSLDYSKAPEYPYPFALDECYDVYRVIVETRADV